MEITIVEDDARSLADIKSACKNVGGISIGHVFEKTSEALVHILNDSPEVVFLDIDMPELAELEIARVIRKNSEQIAIVLITQSEKYVLDAYKLGVGGYLLKPIKVAEAKRVLVKLKKARKNEGKKVFIRTFGHFDVFIDQEPLHFKNAKAKELLALLVDKRGGTVSKELAINVLWDDRRYDDNVKQLYRKAVTYLHRLLAENELDFFVSNRGSCYVKSTEFTCDYYALMDGETKALNSFNGEYMFEYGWAETTLVQIEKYMRSCNYLEDHVSDWIKQA